tara:strand:+ start:5006 stop:6031 length:1026 start_codon:yes stop_codon:yes gene_type:complete
MFKNKSILITGGTGSFGKKFAASLLQKFKDIKRLVIFSRDELKQFEMSNSDPFKNYQNKIRFFLGDVRDINRLRRAFHGIDIVIHAAALKQVPAAEYNPMEFINTNVMGAQNVIEAAIDRKVKNVIALSTDKAASPINLYGATKLCSDKLFIAANYYAGISNFNFSVVRYGNVMGSRGSVIPTFLNILNSGKNKKIFPITDERMTRFNITLEESIETVLFALKNQQGGEIFVPKQKSYKITDVCKSIDKNIKIKIIGIRPGEKIDEEMISIHDGINSVDIGNFYLILPMNKEHSARVLKYYKKKFKIKKLNKNFSYNSKNNNKFLSVKDLKKLIFNKKLLS